MHRRRCLLPIVKAGKEQICFSSTSAAVKPQARHASENPGSDTGNVDRWEGEPGNVKYKPPPMNMHDPRRSSQRSFSRPRREDFPRPMSNEPGPPQSLHNTRASLQQSNLPRMDKWSRPTTNYPYSQANEQYSRGGRLDPQPAWNKNINPSQQTTPLPSRSSADTRPPYSFRYRPRETSSYTLNLADAMETRNEFSSPPRHPSNSRNTFKKRGTLVNAPQNSTTPLSKRHVSKTENLRKTTQPVKIVAPEVYMPTTISVGNLSRLLDVRLEVLQRKMREVGMKDESNYDYVLTSDYAVLIAEEFGCNAIISDEASFDLYPPLPHPDPSLLPLRPPVVTIMGHVDHGKTTLLDTLRSSSIAKGEAGGITQHIGAFSVPVKQESTGETKSITFLDTPGHAAFSAIRARGARVTDIIVLVVAADDGIMPQTREVIELIKQDQGNTGVVVALNKVDKPGVDIDAVQRALLAEGLQLEVFGGDIPCVEVSGLKGHGLPALIETISAVAEIQDIRSERSGNTHGYVLESKVQKGLGPVATVLIMRGCLKPGSHIISGTHHAKVRVMKDSSDAILKAAYPGMAVTVSGWKSLPSAGDEVLQGTESEIKKAIANRQRKLELKAIAADAEAINIARRQEREQKEELAVDPKAIAPQPESGPKELRLIVKADVSGSAEAVVGALQGIGNKQAVAKVVSSGVGEISESDVTMAKAVGGAIVAFSVPVPRSIEILAAQNQVSICSSSIIYRLMDDIKNRVVALLPVIVETRVTGEATVLQLFDIQLKAKQIKKVAGCRVINGIVEKSRFARVVRAGVVVYEGSLDTMRHLKKDVVEVRKGSECGLSIEGWQDLREGDFIQMYEKIEKPGVL